MRSLFDPGAGALAIVLQSLGMRANESEFLYRAGKCRLGAADILALARRLPVRARQCHVRPEQLRTTPLPALGRLHDGSWVVVMQVIGDQIVIQDPNAGGADRLSLSDYATLADGCVITLARAGGPLARLLRRRAG